MYLECDVFTLQGVKQVFDEVRVFLISFSRTTMLIFLVGHFDGIESTGSPIARQTEEDEPMGKK